MPKKTDLAIAMDYARELCLENDRLRGVLRKIACRRPAWGDKMHAAFRLSREEARNALKFPKK